MISPVVELPSGAVSVNPRSNKVTIKRFFKKKLDAFENINLAISSYFILLENGQAINCWHAQYLISKIMDNIELYPEMIRMMTSLNKVTRKIMIIRKFTIPRLLRSYIYCVPTL